MNEITQGLVQIGVTSENQECLDLICKELKYFSSDQDAARFAASLSLRKKLYLDVNGQVKKLAEVGGSGLLNKWDTDNVDRDRFFRTIIQHLDLCPEDYGKGLRGLIILGLNYIWSQLKEDPKKNLSELIG